MLLGISRPFFSSCFIVMFFPTSDSQDCDLITSQSCKLTHERDTGHTTHVGNIVKRIRNTEQKTAQNRYVKGHEPSSTSRAMVELVNSSTSLFLDSMKRHREREKMSNENYESRITICHKSSLLLDNNDSRFAPPQIDALSHIFLFIKSTKRQTNKKKSESGAPETITANCPRFVVLCRQKCQCTLAHFALQHLDLASDFIESTLDVSLYWQTH